MSLYKETMMSIDIKELKKKVKKQQKRIEELEERIAESSRRIKNGLAWIDDYGDDFEMAKDDILAGYEILKGGGDG